MDSWREEVENLVCKDFGNLFAFKKVVVDLKEIPKLKGRKIQEDDRRELELMTNRMEIWKAVKSIGGNKSPGINGYNAEFY